MESIDRFNNLVSLVSVLLGSSNSFVDREIIELDVEVVECCCSNDVLVDIVELMCSLSSCLSDGRVSVHPSPAWTRVQAVKKIVEISVLHKQWVDSVFQ